MAKTVVFQPMLEHAFFFGNSYMGLNARKVQKVAKIRNQYTQVSHLTQDTEWNSDKTQLNITNENQKVSPLPSGYHKAAMHDKHKT